MRYLSFIMILGLFSCEQSASHDKKAVDETEKIETKTSNIITVGEKIQGDFDGDGKVEFGLSAKIKDGKGNPVEGGTPDEYRIEFSTDKLISINVGCCDIRLINEGDLNNNGTDEISIFQSPMNGCSYSMRTYSFTNGNWKQIVGMFLIPTGCESISDEDLQKRVFKEDNSIFYYDTDLNDENGKLMKTKVGK